MTVPLRLTAATEALAALLALVPAPVAARRVPVTKAIGRVLAEAVVAPYPVPPAPVAARDGWAVAAADTQGAGPYAPLPLPGTPAWVEAGDGLPAGADAVLPPFEVDASAGPLAAAALAEAAPGDGTRAAGEEAGAGAVLRAAGERPRALDLPALAALGIGSVSVRAARVAVLPVGDEIAAAPSADALSPALAALTLAEGADAVPLPPVGDDAERIAAALRGTAAGGADLVLAIGGTGEGRRDRSAAGLAAAGRLLLHGIGARPGTTAAVGVVEGRPVVLLPGRPEDALAAWWLLARPALRRLAGAAEPPARAARLARKVASAVGLAELVPLRLRPEDGTAEPLAVGALPLAALAAANALLVVPPESEGYEEGATVDVVLP